MNSNILEKCIADYGKDIFSFCVYLARNKNDAEDLYQQTFLVAFEKNEIDEVKNPKSYISRMTIWNSLQIIRRLWKNRYYGRKKLKQ